MERSEPRLSDCHSRSMTNHPLISHILQIFRTPKLFETGHVANTI